MNILRVRGLVFICLFFLNVFARADFVTATDNYELKKYYEAFEEFKRLASLGHKEAQLNVGVMHLRGEGVTHKDFVEAHAWVALAATGGNENYTHTRDLIFAKLNAAQKEESLKRLEVLVAQFGEQALNEKLTPVMLTDVECQFQLRPTKIEKAKYPPEAARAARNGSVDAEFTIDKLGFVRDYSVLVSTDKVFEKASLDAIKKWRFEPVFAQGKVVEVPVQNVRLRFTIADGKLNEKAIKKYIAELRAKAETGNLASMYTFAYAGDLLKELRIEKQESNGWYLKAAQAGLPQAQYQIGKSLLRGEGCKADVAKGLEWLTLAAKDSSADAQYFLGMSMLGSKAFEQNKKQGIEWLSHAAAANHVKAKMRLAWILATGKDEGFYDPARSLTLVNSIYEGYPDRLRATETLAAAQAANGLFSEAIQTQTQAIKFAKEVKYPIEIGQQRLLAYQNSQAWREQL